MSYAATYPFFDDGFTAPFSATVYDGTGAPLSPQPTRTFVNLGSGSRQLYISDMPDATVGTVQVLDDDGLLVGVAAIDPARATLFGSSGSVEFTYTVYDTDGVTPLPGVAVYASSDSAGTRRSETLLTDDLGRVVFHLDPGTFYFWRSHPRRTFSDPDSETVS